MDSDPNSDPKINEPDLEKVDSVPATDRVTDNPQSAPEPAIGDDPSEFAGEVFGQDQADKASSGSITWTASEFIYHQKSNVWYLMLVIAAVLIAALIWILTSDYFSAGLVLLGILMLGFYSIRKPRQLTYTINNEGINIADRYFPFASFRSFSVIPMGAFSSIELVPLKRLAMYTSIYFAPSDEDRIIKLLSSRLPMEPSRNDPVDQLMRRLRF